MSIPVAKVITCKRCGWTGPWESLFSDEAKGITQALCPECGQVLMLSIAGKKTLVLQNATTA
jgi:predicted RNA-binding Zn-ribbon protein involved in translation (DUF1610 family)